MSPQCFTCPYCPHEVDPKNLETLCSKCQDQLLKEKRDQWQEVDDVKLPEAV